MKLRFVFFVALLTWFTTAAQLDFTEEVAEIVKINDSLWNPSLETVIFTGSSSIRLWGDLKERFPSYHILNTGFGGSETTDLLLHLNDLVLRYKPVKVFIYEGDNDISLGKSPRKIIITTQLVIQSIKSILPKAEIFLISAKPSMVRWNLKGKYRRLNKKLAKLAIQNENVDFINVWNCMLLGKKLRTDLFIEDGLHMNTEGYDLWYRQIKPFLSE